MKKISVTLTTCGRVDLLEQTINSFEKYNTYPIDEFLIINDDPSQADCLERIFKGRNYTLINNEVNFGQMKSLDIIFNLCRNEYIFHMEDDWIFDTETSFIENSIKILESDSSIHQVWIRRENDNPHKSVGDYKFADGVAYKLIDPNFMGQWNGYSWNPGLRRKSDYIKMFPDGISAFKDELECSIHTKSFMYRTVLLNPTACFHGGYGRTTQI